MLVKGRKRGILYTTVDDENDDNNDDDKEKDGLLSVTRTRTLVIEACIIHTR